MMPYRQYKLVFRGNEMATENRIAYALPIIEIMWIRSAKSHKQMRLRLICRERVGIKNFTLLMKNQQGFSLNCINYGLDICTDIQKLKNM